MDPAILKEKIEQIALPLMEEAGLELIDMHIAGAHGNLAIQILADKPQGGITIAQCTYLNKRIGERIENEFLLEEPYTLEVSSPGLDRPLRSVRDFSKVIGQDILLFLSAPVEGKIEYQGRLKGVDTEAILLERDTGSIQIPMSCVHKAKRLI